MNTKLMLFVSCFVILWNLPPVQSADDLTFSKYISAFGRTYVPLTTQYNKRKQYFSQKYDAFLNTPTYTFRTNNFTDWSLQEVNQLFNLQRLPIHNNVSYGSIPERISDATVFDWRDQNIITSVKSQSMCGSSWAHASTALMESYLIRFRNRTNQINLSEDYLINCVQGSDCTSGSVDSALNHLLARSPTQDQYIVRNSVTPISSFVEPQSRCIGEGLLDSPPRKKVYYNVTDEQLISLIQQGPVVALVYANVANWISYGAGTIACPVTTMVNHAVLVIGYTANQYLIKNSWGTGWGTNGLAFISRDPNQNCQITTQVYLLFDHNIYSFCSGLLAILFIAFALTN